MITNFKIFENKETPKFKVGDEVLVASNLTKFGRDIGINKGDIVTIKKVFINANGHVFYYIDSEKYREIMKGRDHDHEYHPEFRFLYPAEVDMYKYNI
jgi:hypothetical protein